MEIIKIENKIKKEDLIKVIIENEIDNIAAENFVDNIIMPSILYTAVAECNPILGRYDFIINKNLVNEIEKHLKKDEKLFSEKTNNILKDNNYAIQCEVDEDGDSYIHIKEELDESNTKIFLFETILNSEELFESIEKKFDVNFDKRIKIQESIENKVKEIIGNKYLYRFNYQLGGNQLYCPQWYPSYFIGCYHGDYMDAGTVSIFINDNDILSQVDSH